MQNCKKDIWCTIEAQPWLTNKCVIVILFLCECKAVPSIVIYMIFKSVYIVILCKCDVVSIFSVQ